MNSAKYEERWREIRDEVISLIKSRRTPEGGIIVDNDSIELLRALYTDEYYLPKKRVIANL